MLVELKALLTPYIDTARGLQAIQSGISQKISQTSQPTARNVGNQLNSVKRASQGTSEAAPTCNSSALIDKTAIADHLAAIRDMQLQSTNAQRSIAGSISTIRDELSNLSLNENVRMQKTLQEQGERFEAMTQHFENVRLSMQELAQAQQDNRSMPSAVTRRSVRIALNAKPDIIFIQSVLFSWVLNPADYIQVYPPRSVVEVLPLAFAVSEDSVGCEVEYES